MTLVSLSILAVTLTAIAVATLLTQVWLASQDEQSSVGPWASAKPVEPSVKLPANYVSLRWGEKYNFGRSDDEWRRLTEKLDEIEIGLGQKPSPVQAPPTFNQSWLEQRVADLESLTGPLPGHQPSQDQKPIKPRNVNELS